MYWEQILLIVLTIGTLCLATLLATVAWQRRDAPAILPFFGLVLAASTWAVFNIVEINTHILTEKIFWAKIQYLGISSIAVFWLLFSLKYVGLDGWLMPRVRRLLWIIPLITVLIAWTNEWHSLLWPRISLTTTPFGQSAIFEHGFWFWVIFGYNYLLVLIGTLALFWAILRYPEIYRRQAGVLLLAAAVPWIGNILYVTGTRAFSTFDMTPFGFLVAGVLLAWSIARYRMLEIIPIAREAVIESLMDGMLVLDTSRRVVDINPKAQQMVGLKSEEVLGHPVESALPWAGEALSRLDQRHETLAELSLDSPMPKHLELRGAPLHDRHKNWIGHVLTLRDITRRKQTEETLHLQSVALESAANGILITDTAGVILWVNPAFTHITGYAQSEAQGQNPRLLKSGMHAPAVYQDLWNTIKSGKIWRGELINRRKNGELYNEEQLISPVYNASGAITHFVGIQHDITHRKRTEEALQRSNLEKQRLQEVKAIEQERNRIAQEIHDGLAQNLAALCMRLGRWHKLLDSNPSRLHGDLDEIQDMVNATLLEARRSIFALRPLPLDTYGFLPALKQFITGFSEYYQVAVHLNVNGDPEDLSRLFELTTFRIIQEALNNIARHAGAANAWIDLNMTHPSCLQIEVRDDGKGFDTDWLPEAESLGHYGLAAMNERARSTGGQLTISSQPGKGTYLVVELPLLEEQ